MNHLYVGLTSALTNYSSRISNALNSKNARRTVRTAAAISLIGITTGLIGLCNTPSELELKMKAQSEMRKPGEAAELKYKTNEDIQDKIQNHKRTYGSIVWGSTILFTSALALYRRKKD